MIAFPWELQLSPPFPPALLPSTPRHTGSTLHSLRALSISAVSDK